MTTELRDDGDTMELDDGRVLRLRLVPDPDASINDYDSDGRVEWTRNASGNEWPYIYGVSQRPEGFSGRARILERDHNSSLWWEPPSIEMVGCDWDAETMRKEETRIRELVQFGFVGVVLELCDAERDAYGHLVVRDTASLWGIEWDAAGDYVAEIAAELMTEIGDWEQFSLKEID